MRLSFTKDDFFNEYEMNQFLERLNSIEKEEEYMKKAIINRMMIEGQTNDITHYEKLMGYIQSKGIEYILNVIEKKETRPQIFDEQKIEEIVYRVLQKQNISFSPKENDFNVSLTSAKKQEKPIGERKKASSKLMKL